MNEMIFLDRETFLSLVVGDEICKFFSHGEDLPALIATWVVKIEPTLSGNIPKMAIQQKDVDEQSFFVHFNDLKNTIINDDDVIFFDYNKKDEDLVVNKLGIRGS